jgi:6-phospho-3-hexuloisomerase
LAAKEIGAKIVAITSYPDSDLGKIADYVVEIRGERRLPKRDITF